MAMILMITLETLLLVAEARDMTTEEKVEYLEDKLARTLQLIKFIIRMDMS